jgi:signal transduction histidine kinase
MRRSSLPSTAATATLPPRDAPDPLLTRGPPASDGLAPPDSGVAASAELIRYLTEDHDRIAQGLNDVVVRRIFAAGLDLQAALGLIGDHPGASKIWHAIDGLDQAVRDIRDTIFDATGPGTGRTPRAHRVDLPIGTAALIAVGRND